MVVRRGGIALGSAVAALALVWGAGGAAPAAGVDLPTTPDRWSPKVTLRTPEGWYASPVHATTLPDGRLLLFGLQRNQDPPQATSTGKKAAWLLDPGSPTDQLPAEITVEEIQEPVDVHGVQAGEWYVEEDLYCAGHTLTSDGKVFTTGGNRRFYRSNGDIFTFGIEYSTRFDPATDTWTRLPGTSKGTSPDGGRTRWYPAVTRLSDGRMLIQGGFDDVTPAPIWNGTAEVWDPKTNSYQVISPYSRTPREIMNSTYTHAFVLPTRVEGRNVLELGEPGVPVFLGVADPADWRVVGSRPRPGSEQFQIDRYKAGNKWNSDVAPDRGASTAMLPLRVRNGEWGYNNGSLVVAGGAQDTRHQQGVDVYDPVANQWTARQLLVRRYTPDIVTLPDGRLLVVGGGGNIDPLVRHTEYLDPRNGFAQSLGASDGGEVRGYHSVKVLLPDGRIFVGGGRDVVRTGSLEKQSFRYYFPDYMEKDRPEILGGPETLTVGQPFAVQTDRALSEIVLVALGSQTHSYDMNQRHVQVPLLANLPATGGNYAIAGGVAGPQVVPPGHYMLFALDAQRVPSVAKIVQVLPVAGS